MSETMPSLQNLINLSRLLLSLIVPGRRGKAVTQLVLVI